MNVLLQNGADVNAVDSKDRTALHAAVHKNMHRFTLQLLCFGAQIEVKTLELDKTRMIHPINDRLKLLRGGNSMGTPLMSVEERRFTWNLAFFFTVKHRVAAFKAYYAIRSFITYNGIFMGPGYDLGAGSIWRINPAACKSGNCSCCDWFYCYGRVPHLMPLVDFMQDVDFIQKLRHRNFVPAVPDVEVWHTPVEEYGIL